ncbi:MAG: 50S ribosomal protein L3 [Desulfurococcales archaeon]|nr:50S ribosomal protein L3 [Desulfurococcales archaeon]
MGARKHHTPRRGSLGVRPRKRAARLVPRVKSWPEPQLEEPKLLGFLGYKAGMTHVFYVDPFKESPTYGKEIFRPVTVIETPPVLPLAIRAYGYDPNRGRFTLSEAWSTPPEELELYRKIKTIGASDFENKLSTIESSLEKVKEIRVIIATQPKLISGIPKKKPDLLEVKIGGGDIQSQLEYAKKIIGNPLPVDKVFKPYQLVDVIAVTKGKGFQGVIKRFGVKELPRWHKHRKGSRKSGSRSHGRGTWSETPQAGQMGYHRRTDYNKLILDIGSNGYDITPRGGFLHYGVVRNSYLLLEGTVPGPVKRPIVIRHAIRPHPIGDVKLNLTYVSLSSKQGN